MLLNRSEQVKGLLVDFGLDVVKLFVECIDNCFSKRHLCLLSWLLTKSIGVNLVNQSQSLLDIHPFRSDILRVLWLQHFCEVNVFWLHVNLQLCGARQIWLRFLLITLVSLHIWIAWCLHKWPCGLHSPLRHGSSVDWSFLRINILQALLLFVQVTHLVLQKNCLLLLLLIYRGNASETLVLILQLPHLIKTVDDLRLLVLVLIQNLHRRCVETIFILLEFYLVVDKEIHEALFFFWRQKRKDKCLGVFLIISIAIIISNWRNTSWLPAWIESWLLTLIRLVLACGSSSANLCWLHLSVKVFRAPLFCSFHIQYYNLIYTKTQF